MKKFLAICLIFASAALAANKAIPGYISANVNDRPTIQSAPDSLGGQADTMFVGPTSTTYFTTSVFNQERWPLIWDGMNNSSSVVAKNPDSVRCSWVVRRKDADTSDISFGINYRMGGSSTSPWTTFGGSIGTGGTNVALTKYTASAPWVGGVAFRPWIVVTTATDTIRYTFSQCRDIVNP